MKKSIIVLSLLSGLLFIACNTVKPSAISTTSPSIQGENKNQKSEVTDKNTINAKKVSSKNGENATPVHSPANSLEKAPSKN